MILFLISMFFAGTITYFLLWKRNKDMKKTNRENKMHEFQSIDSLYKEFKINEDKLETVQKMIAYYPTHNLTIKALNKCLSINHPDLELKYIAARHLKKADAIYPMLENFNIEFIRKCLGTIKYLDSDNYISRLITFLDMDISVNLRNEIIAAIGKTEDVKYADIIINQLSSNNLKVISASLNALKKCGNVSTISFLYEFIEKNHNNYIIMLTAKTIKILIKKYDFDTRGRLSLTGTDREGSLSITEDKEV